MTAEKHNPLMQRYLCTGDDHNNDDDEENDHNIHKDKTQQAL